MPDQTIKCPKCGAEIPLTEALTGQIEQSIRSKYEVEASRKALELEKERQALNQQAKELEAKRQAIEEQVAEQVKVERKKIAEQERAKILAEQSEQTKALEQELEEKGKKLQEMQRQEVELRRKQREIEQKQQELELENQRKLDAERKTIAEEASKRAAEESLLKLREKDDQIESMKRQIDELKRKSDVGSQERQGEALEGQLLDILQQTFPFDKFEEIKRGIKDADILQKVRNQTGRECGSILWESKNTKEFSNKWIEKLKTDQQEACADIAVIMSIALPKEIKNFGPYGNIWITDYPSAIGLAAALRETLIRVTRERAVVQHQDSMKDVIYNYITGSEFTMRVRRVAESYIQMQRDLEAERRAMNTVWKKREKQILVVLDNLSGMRGEIEGIVGGQKALPGLETFSLEAIETEENKEEVE